MKRMKPVQRRKNHKAFDLWLLIIYLACSCYFLIEMLLGQILPLGYIVIASLFLLLLFAILFYTLKWGRKLAFVRRSILGVLCILLILGSIFQGGIRSAFEGMNDGSENISIMNIAVADDSTFDSLKELESMVVGYVADRNGLVEYSMNELDKYNYNWHSYENTSALLSAIKNQEVSAGLVSQSDYALLKDQDSTSVSDIKILDQIQMITKNSEIANDKDITNQPFTVYITGMDDVGKPDYNALSDVNMLLLVDPVNHHVEMISIPRDSYVPNVYRDNYPDKLTHLGFFGSDAVVQAAESVFGFDIDYYAKVSFSSLIEIVDTLGGIEVDVQLEFEEQNEQREMVNGQFINTIHLYPGVQTLNGREALAYARHRHTEGWGDSGRNFAQRQIIKAIVEKMLTIDGVTKINDVLKVGFEYVATNMPASDIKKFVNQQISELNGWTFASTSIMHGVESGAQLCASQPEIYAWVYILSEADIATVYAKYQSLYEQEQLNEFKFDLNDLSEYVEQAPSSKYLVTAESFDDTMQTYFSDYYYGPLPLE